MNILVCAAVLCVAGPALTAVEAAVWRPFSDDSPWNQPIHADAPTDPASASLIDDLAKRGPWHVNIREWSIPVYDVDATKTPRCDVGDSRPGIYGRGFELPRRIPIPDDAVASPPVGEDSDNHLCIVDRARRLEWGMWAARKDETGRWFTGLGAITDLASTGVAPPWYASPRELDSHRARASGFPLIAGLVRLEEIRAGRIEHALVFAYDGCRSEFFVPPASTAQATTPAISHSHGIPMGGRIQLDPAWDVEHSSLSRAGKIIARALQRYGAYCGDYAGGNVLYAENSPAAVAAWKGVLAETDLARVMDAAMIRDHFRVIAMGNLRPGQNLAVAPPYVIAWHLAGERAPAEIDQLARTVTLFPASQDARLEPAACELFPRETQVEFAAAADGATTKSSGRTATLTAPDGRQSLWHFRVAGR